MFKALFSQILQLSDVKEHFYTFLTSLDSCHNCRDPFTNDPKL